MNKSFSTQCNLTKFSTFLLMNIIDITYLISGIYIKSNSRTFLCKMFDIGYYVIYHVYVYKIAL